MGASVSQEAIGTSVRISSEDENITPETRLTIGERTGANALRPQRLESLQAEDRTSEAVKQLLQNFTGRSRDADIYNSTLKIVMDVLEGGVGGTIVAVLHELTLEQNLLFDTLDNGLHTEVFQSLVGNIHGQMGGRFSIMLKALTAHNESDRWEIEELEDLIDEIPEIEQFAEKLLGQPKDGAIIIGHEGTIKGVALHLKYASSKFQLLKHNGLAAGTRHASGLGFAEWLGECGVPSPGVLFARSDAGGAHAFIPRERKPESVFFRTLEIPSNELMVEIFKAKVEAEADVYEKVMPMLIRPGKRGERVVTVLDGKVTADKLLDSDDFVVIRSPNAEQEQYAMRRDRAERTYEDGVDLDKVPEDYWPHAMFLPMNTQPLMELGFKLHKPAPMLRRFVYQFTATDLERVPAGAFRTSFGTIQHLRAGCYITMRWPASKADEMYLISHHALNSYNKIPREQAVAEAGHAVWNRKSAPFTSMQTQRSLFRNSSKMSSLVGASASTKSLVASSSVEKRSRCVVGHQLYWL